MLLGSGFPPLQVSLSSSSISQTDTGSTIISGTVTATPSGGSGAGYSYAWTVSTSDGIYATSPTSATTAFEKDGAALSSSYNAIAYVTVTDTGTGGTVVSGNVGVTLTRSS